MLKIVSSACAALMVLTAPFATPALAMQVHVAPAFERSEVIRVQGMGDDPSRYNPGQHRWGGRDRNWNRSNRNWNRGFERRGGYAYYRGHRGYRDYRPGYRRHGDFWFPPAAFIAGAIIGGALANQAPAPRYRGGGSAHVEWCYARYRSYRDSDNTFQPYNGPRRQCHSPYG